MCSDCSEYHRENKAKSSKTPSASLGSQEDQEVSRDLRSAGLTAVLKAVKSLFTNGPYVFVMLYGTFDALIVNGFLAFGAKFFQQEFGLTATMAGIAFGLSVSQKSQIWHNFVKFPPTLINIDTKMDETILLCTVHSFPTSPNFFCRRTTV